MFEEKIYKNSKLIRHSSILRQKMEQTSRNCIQFYAAFHSLSGAEDKVAAREQKRQRIVQFKNEEKFR